MLSRATGRSIDRQPVELRYQIGDGGAVLGTVLQPRRAN
jgi:hypothetical protein